MQERWKGWYAGVLAALLIGAVWVGLEVETFAAKRSAWLVVLALLGAFAVFAGWAVTGRIFGFLIDQRNRMSLSQLQLVAWTLVIVSAFFTVALARVAGVTGMEGEPLQLAMQSDLWWLLGISTTSLVGTSLILKNKELEQPTPTVELRAAKRVAKLESISTVEAQNRLQTHSVGAVVQNPEPRQARFYDLITGDETGNVGYLDIGKVQMLLFTLVVLVAYAVTLWSGFPELLKTGSFPELDDSMIALLGISHAGYLGSKAAPAR